MSYTAFSIALLSFVVIVSLLIFVSPAFAAIVAAIFAHIPFPRYSQSQFATILVSRPLIAIRNRIAREPDGRITTRRVVLVGPFEIGLTRPPICHPRFSAGAHVIAYHAPHFLFVVIFQYSPRSQTYEADHVFRGRILVPASSVYPVPEGVVWHQDLDDFLEQV